MSRGSSRDRDSMMRDDAGPILTGDKSARSVFVGNIPYEATEEKLKEIFSEVGQVVSFKLVYDRENGKPRGYGFCEYQNPETANCAMRNLNTYEIGGRTLRVDSACTEKNRMEMQAVMPGGGGGGAAGSGAGGAGPSQTPADNGPYGEPVEPQQAPEAISKAVASLPPEQMFELMKQMKTCIQNNPQEARNMLLQNPQLAYALLQAQVVMRIVKPEMALQMLHKNPNQPLPTPGPRGPMMGAGPLPGGMDVPPFAGGSGGGGRPFEDQRPFERDMDQGGRFSGRDPRNRDPRDRDPRDRDPRDRDPRPDRDPRGQDRGNYGRRDGPPPRRDNPPGPSSVPPPGAQTDPARSQLIMQVLQLSDEQIKMLPMEQQMSIMELKKQLNQPK